MVQLYKIKLATHENGYKLFLRRKKLDKASKKENLEYSRNFWAWKIRNRKERGEKLASGSKCT
jgi:hypothetical protein